MQFLLADKAFLSIIKFQVYVYERIFLMISLKCFLLVACLFSFVAAPVFAMKEAQSSASRSMNSETQTDALNIENVVHNATNTKINVSGNLDLISPFFHEP